MTTKKAKSSAAGSGKSEAGTRSKQPVDKTQAVKRRTTRPAEAAEPLYPQARISEMLAEVRTKNDELDARVGRLLKRLS
jgi:hypothetical protein